MLRNTFSFPLVVKTPHNLYDFEHIYSPINHQSAKLNVKCGQCSSRSPCASAQSDLRATLSAIYFFNLGLNDFLADEQADLELHCPHMFEDPFSQDAAHLFCFIYDCLVFKSDLVHVDFNSLQGSNLQPRDFKSGALTLGL